jgi:hypothetical protein
LRQLRKGYLFVFATPEKDVKQNNGFDFENEKWTNKLSFETKFKNKMYTGWG